MPALQLRGSLPALVTPFRDGAVDEAAFVALVERQIAAGAHGLVPVGTTGEAVTLTEAERRRVVELTIATAAGRVPVIAGCGSNATAAGVHMVRHAKEAGADAALVVTPYYNRPSQAGLEAHFRAIADSVDLPLILYNVPGRTGVDLSTEVVVRLAAHPNVAGIKDATGDLARATLMRAACPPDFILLSGDDPTALGYAAHGGQGCISVTANVAPEACAVFWNALVAGDYPAAREHQARLIALHRALFLDASPAPTKFALARLGLCADEVRLPLLPCAEAVRPAILDAMRQVGLEPAA